MVNQAKVEYDCTLNGCSATMTIKIDTNNDGIPEKEETFEMEDGQNTTQLYKIDWNVGSRYFFDVNFDTKDISKAPVLHSAEIKRGVTTDTRGIEIRTKAQLNDGSIDLDVYENSKTYNRIKKDTFSVPEGEVVTYLFFYDVEPGNEFWIEPNISVPNKTSTPPVLEYARIFPYPDVGFVKAEITSVSADPKFGFPSNLTTASNATTVNAENNKLTALGNITNQPAYGRVVAIGESSTNDTIAVPSVVDGYTTRIAPVSLTSITGSPSMGILLALGDKPIGSTDTFQARPSALTIDCRVTSADASGTIATATNQTVRPVNMVPQVASGTPLQGFPSALGRLALVPQPTSVSSNQLIAFPSGLGIGLDPYPGLAIPSRAQGDTSQTVNLSPKLIETTLLEGGIDIELDKKDVDAIPQTPTTNFIIDMNTKESEGIPVLGLGKNVQYEAIQGLVETPKIELFTATSSITATSQTNSSDAGPISGFLTTGVTANLYGPTTATVTTFDVDKGKLKEISGNGIVADGGIGQTSDSSVTEATAFNLITGQKTIAEGIPSMTIIRETGLGQITSSNGDPLPPVIGIIKSVESTPLVPETRGVAATQATKTNVESFTTIGSKLIRTAVVSPTDSNANLSEAFRRTGTVTPANANKFLTAFIKIQAEITEVSAFTGGAISPSESFVTENGSSTLTASGFGISNADGFISANQGSGNEAFRFLSGKITEVTAPNRLTAFPSVITAIPSLKQIGGSGVVPRNCIIDTKRLPDDARTKVEASNPPIPPQGKDMITRAPEGEKNVNMLTAGPSQVTVNTKGPHRVSSLHNDNETANEYEGECVTCKIYSGTDSDGDYYYYTDLVYCGTDESVMHPNIGCGSLDDGQTGYLKDGVVGDNFGSSTLTGYLSAATDVVNVKQASASPLLADVEIGRVWGPRGRASPIQAKGTAIVIPDDALKQTSSVDTFTPFIELSTADSITLVDVTVGVEGVDLPWELEPPMNSATAQPLIAKDKNTSDNLVISANTFEVDPIVTTRSEGDTRLRSESITKATGNPIDAEEFLNWKIEGVEVENVITHEASHDYLKLKIICDEEKARALRTLKRNSGQVNKIIKDTGEYYSWTENNTRWIEVKPPHKLHPLRSENQYLVESFDEKPLGANANSREIQLKLIKRNNKKEFPASTVDYTSEPEPTDWEFRFDKYNIATKSVNTNLSKKNYSIGLELILGIEDAWIAETNLAMNDAIEVVDTPGSETTIYDNNPNKRNSITVNTPTGSKTPLLNPNNNYVVKSWKTTNITDTSFKLRLEVQEPTIPPIGYGFITSVEGQGQEPEISRDVTATVDTQIGNFTVFTSKKAKLLNIEASPIEIAPTIVGTGRVTSASTHTLVPTITPANSSSIEATALIPEVRSLDDIKSANANGLVGEPTSKYSVTITDGTSTEEGTVQAVESDLSIDSYYNYSNGSASTSDIKRRTNDTSATIFLYLDRINDKISLVLIYGRPNNNSGGGTARMSFSDLPSDTNIIVKDDPTDTYSITPPGGYVEHNWGPNGTDGVVLGTWDDVDRFSCSISVDSFTGLDTIRVVGENWDTVQMPISTDATVTISL